MEMDKGGVKRKEIDWPVFYISGGFFLAFIIASFINIDAVSKFVYTAFHWSVNWFGAFWQVICLLTVIISLGLAISKYGSVRLGRQGAPDITTLRWLSMIMMTLLAGGGIFWSAAEPLFHYLEPAPIYPDIQGSTEEAIIPSLATTFVHWSYNVWAILGSLLAVVYMYAFHEKGLPLKPRTLLYPVFGEKGVYSLGGTFADAFSSIAAVASVVGPIGFLALQMGYFLEQLFGIHNVFSTHLSILLLLVAIYTVSAITGLYRGIQFLSRVNVYLAVFLMGLILLVGPGRFIVNNFFDAFILYNKNYFQATLYRGDPEWLGMWTIFFFGWFMAGAPIMGTFIARISRGRTIREIVLACTVIAPLCTKFWFTVLGGSGIYYEFNNPGTISQPLSESGLPAVLLNIGYQLPLSYIFIPGFMIILILFLSTSGDSYSYSIAMITTGKMTPNVGVRAFWGVMMGGLAAVLISIGEGGIDALQYFIIITNVPVAFLLVPSFWAAPMFAKKMYGEQFGGKITNISREGKSKYL